MATKKFTRGPRPPQFDALHEHIETQRSRLMDAEALLDCMLAAIDDDTRLNGTGPSYPTVVRIARALIHSTIDQLDSINVRAALTRVSAETSTSQDSGYRGVKEMAPAYVH